MPNSESFDPSLIVFALLALFVIWKLRSVLGVRVDRETPEPGRSSWGMRYETGAAFPGAEQPAPAPAAPAEDRWLGLAEMGSAAWKGLDAIAASDPRFTAHGFAEGARKAYEIIVGAFARGDRETLRGLLSQEVFDNFAAAIAERESRGEKTETAVVAIDKLTVEEAHADKGVVFVTVRYNSRLMSATRDAKGDIVAGGFNRAVDTIDVWTFARDPRSQDPNWKLVATATGH